MTTRLKMCVNAQFLLALMRLSMCRCCGVRVLVLETRESRAIETNWETELAKQVKNRAAKRSWETKQANELGNRAGAEEVTCVEGNVAQLGKQGHGLCKGLAQECW